MTDTTQAEPKAKLPAKIKKKVGWQQAGPGRHHNFTHELGAKICELLASGRPVSEICKMPRMPARCTVFRWLIEHEDFARAYALAKCCVAEDLFDEALVICDATTKPVKKAPKGSTLIDPATSAKLRIDTRFRMAAKLAPKKYGEMLEAPLLPQVTQEEDSALVIEGHEVPLDHHPLYAQIGAWSKAAKDGAA